MNEKKMLILHIDYKIIFRSDTDTQTSDTHKNRLFKSIMNIISTEERNIKLSTRIILNFPVLPRIATKNKKLSTLQCLCEIIFLLRFIDPPEIMHVVLNNQIYLTI